MKGEEGNKKPLHPSTHHMLSSTTLLWAEDFVPKGNFIDWPLPCHQASSTPLLSLSRDRGSILRSTNEEYPEFYVPLSVIRKERPMWKFTLPLSPSCFWYWFDGLHRVLSWLINDLLWHRREKIKIIFSRLKERTKNNMFIFPNNRTSERSERVRLWENIHIILREWLKKWKYYLYFFSPMS